MTSGELAAQAELLGERHEAQRRDELAVELPASQRLGGDRAAAGQVDHGLEDGGDGVRAQCGTEAPPSEMASRSCCSTARLAATSSLMAESNATARPRPLRLAAYIAASAQRSRSLRSSMPLPEDGDADGQADPVRRAADLDGLVEQLDEPLGGLLGHGRRWHRRDDRELVAAEPGGALVRPQRVSSRSPTSRSRRSPARWPRVSLTFLNRSMSSSSRATSSSGSPVRACSATSMNRSSDVRFGMPVSASWVVAWCSSRSAASAASWRRRATSRAVAVGRAGAGHDEADAGEQRPSAASSRAA